MLPNPKQIMGIEPILSDWKSDYLPLIDICYKIILKHFYFEKYFTKNSFKLW